MRSLFPTTAAQDGSDPYPLQTLGTVGAFVLHSEWPGGCIDASFTLGVGPTFSHRALSPGRMVTIRDCGWPVWYGVLTDPTVDNPWTINAAGAASLAAGYACTDANGYPSWNPNLAAAQAIARGLPWNPLLPTLPNPYVGAVALHAAVSVGATTVTVTLTSGPAPAQDQVLLIGTGGSIDYVTISDVSLSGSVYTLTVSPFAFSHLNGTAAVTQPAGSPGQLSDLLNSVADSAGLRWGVDAHGILAMTVDNTTPGYLVVAVDKPGGRTIDNYVTDLYGDYLNSDTGQTAPVSATAATPLSYVRKESYVDLTPLGGMKLAAAQALLTSMLTNASARAFFTGTLTVQPGNLLTTGGIPVPLTVLNPNDCVTFLDVQPDPQYGEPSYTHTVTVPVGYLDYDGDADTLQLAPTNHDLRDLTSVLAA